MPRPTYTSEDCKRFTDADAALMERRVSSIAAAWRKRLRCDPALGVDDLEQELRLWYWIYWQKKGHPEYDSKIRKWARAIMRMWGYHGSDHDDKGLFHNDRVDCEQSVSRSPLTREYDLTDEEILSRLIFRQETGMPGGLGDDE